jgi:hypothetical protein
VLADEALHEGGVTVLRENPHRTPGDGIDAVHGRAVRERTDQGGRTEREREKDQDESAAQRHAECIDTGTKA